MKERRVSSDMQLRAAIIRVSDHGEKSEDACEREAIMENILKNAGYHVTEKLVLPENSMILKAYLVRLTDNKKADLIFISNENNTSLKESIFEMEDRSALEEKQWMRMWSRQRILYNEFDHAITVVRGNTLIMDFEGSFRAGGRELQDILELWRETCLSENCG